jgi:hypothetical protein
MWPLALLCLSDSLHVTTQEQQNRFHGIWCWGILLQFVSTFHLCLKLDISSRHFTWRPTGVSVCWNGWIGNLRLPWLLWVPGNLQSPRQLWCHWHHLQRSKLKFWQTHQKFFAVHTFPNLLFLGVYASVVSSLPSLLKLFTSIFKHCGMNCSEMSV